MSQGLASRDPIFDSWWFGEHRSFYSFAGSNLELSCLFDFEFVNQCYRHIRRIQTPQVAGLQLLRSLGQSFRYRGNRF